MSPEVESVSVFGLKLSFGEDSAFDGPASLARILTGAEANASYSAWKQWTTMTILTFKT